MGEGCPAAVVKRKKLSHGANASKQVGHTPWGCPNQKGMKSQRAGRISTTHSCHSVPKSSLQTGIFWKVSIAVAAIVHILIMNTIPRLHRKEMSEWEPDTETGFSIVFSRLAAFVAPSLSQRLPEREPGQRGKGCPGQCCLGKCWLKKGTKEILRCRTSQSLEYITVNCEPSRRYVFS